MVPEIHEHMRFLGICGGGDYESEGSLVIGMGTRKMLLLHLTGSGKQSPAGFKSLQVQIQLTTVHQH